LLIKIFISFRDLFSWESSDIWMVF